MRKILLVAVGLIVLVPALMANDLRYSVEVRDAPLGDLARMLVQMDGKNVVVPGKVDLPVTASFGSTTLMDALNAILQANGYGSLERNDIVQVTTKDILEKMGADLEIDTIALKYSKSIPVAAQAKALISERGTVVVDERTNAVTIRDTRERVANIRRLVSSIDHADRQVLIEAKIVEASEDFTRSVGIQWGISRTGPSLPGSQSNVLGIDHRTGVGGVGAGGGMVNSPSSTILSGVTLATGSFFKGGIVDAQITAGELNGLLNILSRPSVVTLNNQAATINSGVKFYVKSPGNVSIGSATSGATAATSNLQEIRAGITMSVTPQITGDNRVNLLINVTESQPNFGQTVDGTPSINDNSASTTVLLYDGETTVIGGLFQLRKSRSSNGVPVLNRVPLFGALFGNRTKDRSKKELIIFITPSIVQSVPQLPTYPEAYEKITTLKPEPVKLAPEPTMPQQ